MVSRKAILWTDTQLEEFQALRDLEEELLNQLQAIVRKRAKLYATAVIFGVTARKKEITGT